MNPFKDSASANAGKRYPEPVVGALVFNKKGEIILINSQKFGGKYIVPGGHIEIGETMEQALIREMKEETNLDITNIEFLMVQEGTNRKDTGFHSEMHFIFLDFIAEAKNNDVIIEKREADGFVWVKPRDALNLDLNKSTRIFIEKYLEKNHGA